MSGSAHRIGVAGAGNIASIAQLPTLVARDDVGLRALVTRQESRNKGTAKRVRRVLEPYRSWAQACDTVGAMWSS
jgi:predicted dehydrogenase